MRSGFRHVLPSTRRIRRLPLRQSPWTPVVSVNQQRPMLFQQHPACFFSSTIIHEETNSATKSTKVLINDFDSSIHKLLATEDPLSPEAWIESEELMSMLLQEKSIRSVKSSFQLLDRLLVDLPSPFGDWIDTNLLDRLVGLWRVVCWENDIPDYSVSQMFDRVLHYVQYHNLGSEKSLYLIVEAGVRSGKAEPEFAENVLDKCIDLWQEGNSKFYPSPPLFNIVTRAWVLAQRPETVTRVEAVVKKMVELMIPLNRESYLNMIQALSSTGSTEAAMRCEDILDRMMHAYHAGEISFSPQDGAFGGAFGMTITAWLKSGSLQMGRKAEEILKRMMDLDTSHLIEKRDIVPAFNVAIQCQAKAGTIKGAHKAQEFFNLMQDRFTPDYVSYLNLIQAWSEVGQAARVEAIVERMRTLYKSGNEHLRPDSIIMTALISAHARSNSPDKVEKAEEILRQMTKETDPALRPVTITYNAFLRCLVDRKTDFPASKAEQILSEMKSRAAAGDVWIAPDVTTYTTVIHIWASSGNGEKASAILDQMCDDFLTGKSNVKPNLQCFNAVLASFIKSKKDNKASQAEDLLYQMKKLSDQGIDDVKPDIYSYSSLLACYSEVKDNREEAGTRAYNLLQEMKKAYQNGDLSLRPNVVCYNSVMNGWARMKNPRRVSEILREMFQDYEAGNESAKPDVRSFNTLLKAWSLTSDPFKGERAEKILQSMIDLSESGILDVSPNVISYTTVLTCYGSSNRPHKAEGIFNKMEELHAAGKLGTPTKQTLQLLKKAWSTSKEKDKRARVKAIGREIARRFGTDSDRK